MTRGSHFIIMWTSKYKEIKTAIPLIKKIYCNKIPKSAANNKSFFNGCIYNNDPIFKSVSLTLTWISYRCYMGTLHIFKPLFVCVKVTHFLFPFRITTELRTHLHEKSSEARLCGGNRDRRGGCEKVTHLMIREFASIKEHLTLNEALA